MRTDQKIIDEIAEAAYTEFDHLSDYIWKTPEFIETQHELETEKLDDYFPFTGDATHDEKALYMRKLRWRLESVKLEKYFPHYMAISNLFLCLSLFEFYCLRLAKQIEQDSGKEIHHFKGNGLERLLSYLADAGLEVKKARFERQLQCAIKIRNCFIHANGSIEWMKKDKLEIRRIIKTKEYYSKQKFDGSPREVFDPIVRILDDELGERVVIENEYAFTLSAYLKRCFIDICGYKIRVIEL